MNTNPSARRNFLLGATVATAGAVAAVVTGSPTLHEAASPSGEGAAQKKVKGYHVTPHIEQYYDTTRM